MGEDSQAININISVAETPKTPLRKNKTNKMMKIIKDLQETKNQDKYSPTELLLLEALKQFKAHFRVPTSKEPEPGTSKAFAIIQHALGIEANQDQQNSPRSTESNVESLLAPDGFGK